MAGLQDDVHVARAIVLQSNVLTRLNDAFEEKLGPTEGTQVNRLDIEKATDHAQAVLNRNQPTRTKKGKSS